MTAAAAIRWLNGDDFSLLPRQETTKTTREENDNDKMKKQVEAVVEQIRLQTQQQEKILQRLSSHFEKQRTNQCVDLLRASQPDDDIIWMDKLTSIHDELTALRQSFADNNIQPTPENNNGDQEDDNWNTRLSGALENLQNCMTHIATKKKSVAELPESSLDSRVNSVCESSPASVMSMSDEKSIDFNDMRETDRNNLERSIQTLVERNTPEDLRAGTQLLYLYVSNLSNHPTAPRYRKIFTTNDSFQKVDRLVGGKEFLFSIGFLVTGNCMEWKPRPADDTDYHRELLNNALSALNVLKTVPRDVQQPELFVERAVSAALGPSSKTPSSCPPTPIFMSPSYTEIQTPEMGLIASPPNTRKQVFDSENPEFPLLHHSTSYDEMPNNSVDLPLLTALSLQNSPDNERETSSPVRGAEGNASTDATDVVWNYK